MTIIRLKERRTEQEIILPSVSWFGEVGMNHGRKILSEEDVRQ
jgi:hypothetical protein